MHRLNNDLSIGTNHRQSIDHMGWEGGKENSREVLQGLQYYEKEVGQPTKTFNKEGNQPGCELSCRRFVDLG